MKARGWVCPDCERKLDEPRLHECPHGQVCVPGFVGGPPSGVRDECDECARGVLVIDMSGPLRRLPNGWLAPTPELTGWAKRKQAEEFAAQERRDARSAAQGAAERAAEKIESRKRAAREESRLREQARETAKVYGPRVLAALRRRA